MLRLKYRGWDSLKRDWYKQFKDIIYYLSKILSWSCFALLIVVAGLFAYFMVETKLNNTGQGRPKMALYSILTGSMEPNIKVDDVILTFKVAKPENLKVGDVITFVSENSHTKGAIITHRIARITNKNSEHLFHTKGDFNEKEDNAPVSFSGIIGKVAIRIPKLGLLRKLVSNKMGWVLLVLVPAASVIIYDLFRVKKTAHLNKTAKKISKQKKETEIRDVSELKRRLLAKRKNAMENQLPDLRN